jgi:hypothetical protein
LLPEPVVIESKETSKESLDENNDINYNADGEDSDLGCVKQHILRHHPSTYITASSFPL